MKFSTPLSRLVLVAGLLGRSLCIPLAGDHRLGDRPEHVDQQVGHVRTRYQPSRLVDVPLYVNDTAPEAIAEIENDRRKSTPELQTPSTGIGQSIEHESVTLAARGDTTLKPKTRRTNISSYLSFDETNQKLIKLVKHTKLMNTLPSTNDTAIITNTTHFIHPGFSPQRLPGITYAPYDLTGCRSPANITSDFAAIAKTGLYSSVRIYGVDCSQVLNTLRAASSVSPPLTLFLGIFNLSDLSSQITTLVKDVQTFVATSPPSQRITVGDVWNNMIDTISVGNELVNNGQATPAQVLAAVRTVREVLRREGYQGPVVTVDTFVAVLQHPQLCSSPDTDYCAVNIHPFFDPHTDADQAGNFVRRQVLNLRETITPKSQQANDTKGGGGAKQEKRVVVTEVGWPKQGNANNRAVPGRPEQQRAVEGVMKVWREGRERGFADDGDFEMYLFTAFDDEWKKADKGTFYAEQFWGLHNR